MGDDPSDTQAAASSYIEEMATELAKIARCGDLPIVAYLLDMVVAEAAEIHRTIECRLVGRAK